MGNRYVSQLLGALALLGIAAAAAAEPPASYQTCIACHGSDGQGNPQLNAPALAGQEATYLERQLQNFQSGARGADSGDTFGAQMATMAAPLAATDIPILAQYLAGLPRPVVTVEPDEGNLKNGSNYFQANCGACHGGKAEGNPQLHAPALVGLDAAYLLRQMHNFQNDLRGTHADDRYGKQMRMMSKTLPSEQTLQDVLAYIQSLSGQP